jgi:hypothetical protein
MTLDQDTVEQDIIDALRSEASAPVPPELRARVAGRLAIGAGISGLATSVAGATQAAAPAVGGGAGALTLLGLTKTLLVGMGLGAGAGLGLHVAFRPGAAADPAPSVMAVAPAAPVASAEPTTRMSVHSRPASDPEGAEPIVPPTPSRTTRAVIAPPEARMNPAPELPHGSAPEAAKSLAEQQALLDEARAALRRGDGQAALAALREHVARFPRTSFDEEREAVAIKGLMLVGRRDEATEREAAFERRFPASLLAPSLRAALGASAPKDSVTERAVSSQTQGRE